MTEIGPAMPSSAAKSAERAFDVLQLLAAQGHALSTAEITAACGIPKSSAHQLLNAMHRRGFVRYREAERLWELGDAVLDLAASYRRSDTLQVKAGPILATLAGEVGCTAHLAVLRGTEVLYLDKRESRAAGIQLVTEIGVRLPACYSAVGQAILAFMPVEAVDELYVDYSFDAARGGGPTDVGALHSRLEDVRLRGVSHDSGMVTAGVSCIAAPVFTSQGPAGAVGVSFISAQRDHDEIAVIEQTVADAAAHLTREVNGLSAGSPTELRPGAAREPR